MIAATLLLMSATFSCRTLTLFARLTYPALRSLRSHPEAEAYWVLTAIMSSSRLCPPDYYSSDLSGSRSIYPLAPSALTLGRRLRSPSVSGSRTDQAVLVDLVALELPSLAAHLEELGAELPAISFSWFLSLFTDCRSSSHLPYGHLFRSPSLTSRLPFRYQCLSKRFSGSGTSFSWKVSQRACIAFQSKSSHPNALNASAQGSIFGFASPSPFLSSTRRLFSRPNPLETSTRRSPSVHPGFGVRIYCSAFVAFIVDIVERSGTDVRILSYRSNRRSSPPSRLTSSARAERFTLLGCRRPRRGRLTIHDGCLHNGSIDLEIDHNLDPYTALGRGLRIPYGSHLSYAG
jgi:hypothetical protein